VYVAVASNNAIAVNTISAPSGGSVVGLPGLAPNTDSNLTDFYLVQSGANGATYDVLYVLKASAENAGTISKFSLVSGSWVSNGTYSENFGGFGMAAIGASGQASLYVSTGLGDLTNNKVVKVTDTAGYNAPISVTTGNNVTLYSASGNAIVKGLDFAPLAGPLTAPAILTNPTSTTIVIGTTTTLSVVASGTAPLTYQWYRGNTATRVSRSVRTPRVSRRHR
jgi:hypothetical protein